jgi:chlorobactene glucosyltransferase
VSWALLLAVPWAVVWFTLVRLLRSRPRLEDVPAVVEGGPLVSVIIPARNESRTIATVVTSLLASSYRNLEVIVVDDRSTDDTAAQVARLGAEDAAHESHDPRLVLVHGAELPAGWYGKPWACVQGFRVARGDVLLFTDADTRHDAMLLPHAIGALAAGKGSLITVAPHQRCVTFWERTVMPQIWALLGFRFHPQVVNRARHARDVIANGQFILMRRRDYEAIGTHASVRDAVAEDLALAQRCRGAGMRIWFGFARTLMETRMYHGLGHLVEGWSKNIYLGGRQSFPDEPVLRGLVPVALILAIGFWLLPPVALVLGWAGLIHELLGAAALATGLSVAYWAVISASMRIPLWYGACFPLGALVAVGIVLRSTWRGARRVEWKGRVYGAEP